MRFKEVLGNYSRVAIVKDMNPGFAGLENQIYQTIQLSYQPNS